MTTYMIATEVELPKDPSDWQVKDLEKLILEKGRAAMREAFARMLRDQEKAILKGQPEWNLKERWPKKIATLFGDVKWERYRVWDAEQKKSRYPLDEVWGMTTWQKETPAYRDMVVEQVVQRSYRQSQREVKRMTGSRKSVMGTWSLVQQEAQRARKAQEATVGWKKHLLPTPPRSDRCAALGIDLDGTYCRSWKRKHLAKDHAVRVAVLYRHKERVGRKRWLLKDKQVVVSGPGEGLAAFLDRVTQKAVTHYGLHQNTKVVVHGDGDPWIRHYALHHFPKALYRLDPWHVRKKIKETTGLKRIYPSWEKSIYGDPDALILKLEIWKLKKTHPRSGMRGRLNDLISYLRNNRAGLLPSDVTSEEKAKHPRLYLRGSGTIERNIAWAVNDRFKLPRMSWSEKGLANLLILREHHLNQHQQPVYPPVPGRPLKLLRSPSRIF